MFQLIVGGVVLNYRRVCLIVDHFDIIIIVKIWNRLRIHSSHFSLRSLTLVLTTSLAEVDGNSNKNKDDDAASYDSNNGSGTQRARLALNTTVFRIKQISLNTSYTSTRITLQYLHVIGVYLISIIERGTRKWWHSISLSYLQLSLQGVVLCRSKLVLDCI